MNKSAYVKTAAALLSLNVLFACSNDGKEPENSATAATSASAEEVLALINEQVSYTDEDYYSDWKKENATSIVLNGSAAEFPSDATVLLEDNILTIKAGGVYEISGTWDNGQIKIDAEDKNTVKLVLNGVEINNTTGSAIYVANAEKTVISLAEDTVNTISDGENYIFADENEDEPNAALFSKDNLTINGPGKLIVNGQYNNAITSKDELKITGGEYQITAADDGIMGRDLLAVKEGSFTIDAGGDGLKSSNDKDADKGSIALENGTFNIIADSDGVQSVSSLLIAGGTYTVTAGGGSPDTIAVKDTGMGRPFSSTNETEAVTEEDTTSTKGLKASAQIMIGGGDFTIDTLDDALHSNDSLSIYDGQFSIATGDDALHADAAIEVNGGNINITKSYEGIEANDITINDGDIQLVASDDGVNAAGGNDGSAMDFQASSGEHKLQINGGALYVDASGDGLDANGSIEMTGGTVFVNGPVNNGNGSLDYDGSFTISGGTIIAAGSSGMTQAASAQSEQAGIMMTYPEQQEAGTIIHLEDAEGNTILTFAPAKEYQSVFISTADLKKDTAYTLYSGGSSAEDNTNGLYAEGSYEGGTKLVEFTTSDTITWINESGVTEANSGGFGGGGARGGLGAPGEQTAETDTSGEQVVPGDGEGAPNPDGSGIRPGGGMPNDLFGDLDEETQQKVQEIMEQEQGGTITREEAQSQLAELGIDMPMRSGGRETQSETSEEI
ncbi:carbohydrate-binding domain-containing protein [Cytobacillus gottheilii]|uniref:Carbohydrate-binding domain-containing protein n=1 Tax=Cytobacillus gottheilii TaxID=859144 RepID=A0ABX8FEF0_9BACI|nr:carbohydrate-binding domain-containing protein [Cytobacillus gottheilii]QVY62391.1 carbohydrate-binding domain-containing protein [Cytobacillus gottheilii]